MGLLLLIIAIFLITDQFLFLLHVIDDDMPYTLHGVLHGFAKALPLCLFFALVDFSIIGSGIKLFPKLNSKVRAILDFIVSSLFCFFICYIAHRYNWLWIDMDDTLCCNITVVLILEGYFTQQQQIRIERELAQLNQEKAEYKYYALKNQLNPHFLFNSLNVLASLTRVDTQMAYGFVKKLASVYRFLAELDSEEVTRNLLFTGLMFEDYRNAIHGLPSIHGDKDLDLSAAVTYKNVEHSLFVNAELSRSLRYQAFIPKMTFEDGFIIEEFQRSPHNYHSSDTELEMEISQGITSFKGKIGLEMELSREDMSIIRNNSTIPIQTTGIEISPYVNGRLTSWMNMIYKLSYERSKLQMKQQSTTSSSQEYMQSLEFIVRPVSKLNFSLLGEHYYTEFSDDTSKHMILMDFKAEMDLNQHWQLLLTARNLLNQKTYNYTLNDSEKFTKSFTSYNIRPRNILLGIYYKF